MVPQFAWDNTIFFPLAEILLLLVVQYQIDILTLKETLSQLPVLHWYESIPTLACCQPVCHMYKSEQKYLQEHRETFKLPNIYQWLFQKVLQLSIAKVLLTKSEVNHLPLFTISLTNWELTFYANILLINFASHFSIK